MRQRSPFLGNTEGFANSSETTRELTKITTGMYSGMRSTSPQYLYLYRNHEIKSTELWNGFKTDQFHTAKHICIMGWFIACEIIFVMYFTCLVLVCLTDYWSFLLRYLKWKNWCHLHWQLAWSVALLFLNPWVSLVNPYFCYLRPLFQ